MWQSDLLYAAQFASLRAYLAGLTGADLTRPSVLDGWTVADLIAHLCGTADSVAVLEPVPAGPDLLAANDSALTVGDYLAAYGPAREEIAAAARTLRSASPDPRADLDAAQQRALATLGRLGAVDRVVRARRGPILLSAFLDTRLIELVVHAGDLAASVPDARPPRVLTAAASRVVTVLREVLAARSDDPSAALTAASELPTARFVALAAGREPAADPLPPALVAALPLF